MYSMLRTITINSAIIEEVAKYPNIYDAIREYISNSFDADSKKLLINIQKDVLIIEDYGTGISDLDTFWNIAGKHKKEITETKLGRKPIGRMGLGKLSYLMLGELMTVQTQTEKATSLSRANFDKMTYELLADPQPLGHNGTRIIIEKLKVKLSFDDLYKYIENNLYGIILPIATNEPMEIIINGQKVLPVKRGNIKDIKQDDKIIKYCLVPSKHTKIDLLFRGVKIKETNPAPNRPCIGYINVDWLIPTPDRSNFVDNDDTREFFRYIKEYITKTIPSKEETAPKNLEKIIQESTKIYDKLLALIMPKNNLGSGKSPHPIHALMSLSSGVKHANNQNRHNKKHTRGNNNLKSQYGINYIIRKEGIDKPAVIPYKNEKIVIINLDNALIQNIMKLDHKQKSIAFGFLLARGNFHILKEFKGVSEYDEYLDNLIASYMEILNGDQ